MIALRRSINARMKIHSATLSVWAWHYVACCMVEIFDDAYSLLREGFYAPGGTRIDLVEVTNAEKM